jgi:hypothetical protein
MRVIVTNVSKQKCENNVSHTLFILHVFIICLIFSFGGTHSQAGDWRRVVIDGAANDSEPTDGAPLQEVQLRQEEAADDDEEDKEAAAMAEEQAPQQQQQQQQQHVLGFAGAGAAPPPAPAARYRSAGASASAKSKKASAFSDEAYAQVSSCATFSSSSIRRSAKNEADNEDM